jgi:RHS repeat-associated protein
MGDREVRPNTTSRSVPLRLPGQYFDQETGLHQNYFRDYDPKMGRYIEPDPIGVLLKDVNSRMTALNHLYAYAGNNPLRFSDRFGLHYLIDPSTGGYKPHRHQRDGMIDPFPGPGMLNPDPKNPDHNSWANCIKCNDAALMACLGETADDMAGCVQCSTLPPGPAKVAACASCAAGSARAAICVFEHCQSGRQDPCSRECK